MNRSNAYLRSLLVLFFHLALFSANSIFAQNGACDASTLIIGVSPVLMCGSPTIQSDVTVINGNGPSNTSINTPAGCASPAPGQEVKWSLFGAQAGTFEWQLLAPNGDIHYALYELQGNNCSANPILLVDCGTQFNTWQTPPVNPIILRRYYLAVWSDDPAVTDASFQVLARNACGGCETLADCCVAFGGTLDTTPIEACEGSPSLALDLGNNPPDANFSQIYDYRYFIIDKNGGASDGDIVEIDSVIGGPSLVDIDVSTVSNYEICGLSFQRTQNAMSPKVGDSFTDFVASLSGGMSDFCANPTDDCIPVTINPAGIANYTPVIASSNAPSACGQMDGSIIVGGFQIGQSYTIYYSANGTATSFGPITSNTFGEINITGLEAGRYDNFIVTDNSGCGTSIMNMESVGLYPSNGEVPTVSQQNPTSCMATNGRIDIGNVSSGALYIANYNLNGVPTTYGPASAFNGVFTIFTSVGTYTNIEVIHFSTNCKTEPLPVTTVVLESGDQPDAPIVAASVFVCEGEAINFNVVVPSSAAGATWQWSGPNNFSSTEYEPSISSSTLTDAGIYSVVMTQNTCASPAAEVTVMVNTVPSQPQINTIDPICEGEDIVLTSPSTCGRYFWLPPGGSIGSSATNPLLNTSQNTTTISSSDDEYLAGMWSLVCVNNSCNSTNAAAQEVVLNDAPSTPIPQVLGIPCEGGDLTLRTVNQYPAGTSYTWFTTDPSTGASPASTQSTLTLSNLTATNYSIWIQVESNTCSSEIAMVSFPISPTPLASPSISGGGCGEDLQLFANISPANGPWSISWSHPNGFSSNDENPIITNPSTSDAGDYTIVVTNTQNGCNNTATLTGITVSTDLGYQPNITANSNTLCAGETLNLETAIFTGNNVSYIWSSSNSATPIATTTVPTLAINDLNMAMHTATYSVQVNADGCTSSLSPTMAIVVQALPNTPTITAPSNLCPGEMLNLETATIANATYFWSGPNGWTSNDQNPVINTVDASHTGTYTLFIEIGACASEASTFEFSTNAQSAAPIVSNNSPLCEGETLILTIENANATDTYTWFNSQDAMIGMGSSLQIPNVNATTNNDFYVLVGNPNGCNAQSPTIGLEVIASLSLEATVGTDAFACNDTYQLTANDVSTISNVTGTWAVLTGAATFSNVNDPNATVSNLADGETILEWRVEHNFCDATASDRIMLTTLTLPTLDSDEYRIEFGDTLSNFNPLENDALNMDSYLFDFSTANNGTVRDNGDETFTYIPNGNFSGTDNFTYTICSEFCPNQCVETTVSIIVQEQTSCEIPTAFTPNGDGVNDTFVVPCIGNGIIAELIVFNRWGDEVYRNPIYQNEWDGRYKSDNLPTGTYFYVLEYAEIGIETVRGYVYLQRE